MTTTITKEIRKWLNPCSTTIEIIYEQGVVNYLATLELIGDDPDERGGYYKITIVPAGTTPSYTGWLLTTFEGSLTQVLRETKTWV